MRCVWFDHLLLTLHWTPCHLNRTPCHLNNVYFVSRLCIVLLIVPASLRTLIVLLIVSASLCTLIVLLIKSASLRTLIVLLIDSQGLHLQGPSGLPGLPV